MLAVRLSLFKLERQRKEKWKEYISAEFIEITHDVGTPVLP